MRQLKQFMRNRKKEMLACGPCECRTLQCWRYANENCGCGGNPSDSLVSKSYVTMGDAGVELYLFGDENSKNYIHFILGHGSSEIDTKGIFESSNFDEFIDELTNGMAAMFTIGKVEGEPLGIMQTGTFSIYAEPREEISSFINNPTSEALDSLILYLQEKSQTLDFIGEYENETLGVYKQNEVTGIDYHASTSLNVAIVPYGAEIEAVSSDENIIKINEITDYEELPIYGKTVEVASVGAGEASITISLVDDPTVNCVYTISVLN